MLVWGAAGGNDAPGLNENAGRAGALEAGFSSPAAATARGSIADIGLRLGVREYEVEADDEDGRGGKTNGGFGGGGLERGNDCGGFADFASVLVESAAKRAIEPSRGEFGVGGSIIMSGPVVVAMVLKESSRSAAPKRNWQLRVIRRT